VWIALVAVVVVGLIVSGTVVLVTGSGSSSSAPSLGAPASPAAQRLLRLSLGAARRAGSFHYVSSFTSQGVSQHTIGDAGPASGRQVITIGTHTFTVLVIGSACYFRGDANALSSQLGLSSAAAAAHSGQWIALAPTDGPYAAVYAAVTAPSALADNIAFKPQRDLGTSTVSGRRVHTIIGAMTNVSVNGQTQQARGNAELDTAPSTPRVPVRYTEQGTIDKQAAAFTMIFSHWGEPVTVVAPPGALSFSSLGPGATVGPPGSTTLV
jgi:hypothetical protein